jgi:hypothetical protein
MWLNVIHIVYSGNRSENRSVCAVPIMLRLSQWSKPLNLADCFRGFPYTLLLILGWYGDHSSNSLLLPLGPLDVDVLHYDWFTGETWCSPRSETYISRPKGSWRWYINTMIDFLDMIHLRNFDLKRHLWDRTLTQSVDLVPSSGLCPSGNED